MKRFVKVCGIIFASLILFGGTAISKEKKAKQTTLKVWSIWSADSESNKAPFLKTIEEYKKAHPEVKIELTMTEAEAYKTKIRTAVAANDAPDVFYYNAGGMLKSFVDAKKVLPLSDYMSKEDMSRIVDGTLSNMTFDGKVYQLPYTLACSVMFVNTELFDKYNVKIPETWKELLQAVKTFKDAGITPMALGGKDRWTTCMYTDLIMLRAAGYEECDKAFYKKPGANFQSAGMKLAAEKYEELIKAGAFPKDTIAITRDESEVPFYAGKIPMYVNGNWTAANCQASSSAVKGKIKAVRFPVIEGGKGSINDFMGGAAEGFCVSAKTKQKEKAIELCTYLAENHSRNAYMVGAGMPTWKMKVDDSKVDPLIKSIVDLTSKASNFLLWGNTALEGNDSETMMDIVSEMLSGDITSTQFCAKFQEILK